MLFEDRVSTYPNRYAMTDENGNVSHVLLERADEPITTGTPLNAETFNGMAEEIERCTVKYVTEKGESNGIKYCKYNDGTAECWGEIKNVYVPSGGSINVTDKLPLTFTTLDDFSASLDLNITYPQNILCVKGVSSSPLVAPSRDIIICFALKEGFTGERADIFVRVCGKV